LLLRQKQQLDFRYHRRQNRQSRQSYQYHQSHHRRLRNNHLRPSMLQKPTMNKHLILLHHYRQQM
jgi:hypothetical protein